MYNGTMCPSKMHINPNLDWLFRGCSWMVRGEGGGGQKALPKICHTHPTMTKLGAVISYSKKTQKIYESLGTPLEFC